jgi:hypothetical protein
VQPKSAAIGHEETVDGSNLNDCRSAEAAAGDLADHFRYEVVTEHRLVNPANGSFLIFYAAGPAIRQSKLETAITRFLPGISAQFPPENSLSVLRNPMRDCLYISYVTISSTTYGV